MGTSSFYFLYYLPWSLFTLITIIYIFDSLRHKESKKLPEEYSKVIKRLEERDRAFKATKALNDIILETLEFNKAAQQIANVIPQFLGYQTGVLALVDEKKGVLKRVAISETSGGVAALKSLEIPFSTIEIKLTDKDNYCIKALYENKEYHTTELYDVLRPVISLENSNKVQEMMGTHTTLIFPIYTRENKPFGTFLVSMSKSYQDISEYEHQTIINFVDGIRIALRNATLYTSLENTSKELKLANEKLTALDKLKNEFVSVASHELRTPMTAIKSYLWMALEGKGGGLNEKQKYYIQRSYNSVDRLIRLVNDMLNISRIESGRISIDLQSADLVNLSQEVIEEVMPRAKEVGVAIEMPKNQSYPHVLADPDKIKEVLFNLIGNSLKFTPKGGKITISFVRKGDIVETSVTDTGAGITAEDIGKLFQKFGLLPGSYITNQTSTHMGTGLGLYICRAIIHLHHGEIKAASKGRGKGSTFSFTLRIFKNANAHALKKENTHDKDDTVGLIHQQV